MNRCMMLGCMILVLACLVGIQVVQDDKAFQPCLLVLVEWVLFIPKGQNWRPWQQYCLALKQCFQAQTAADSSEQYVGFMQNHPISQ